MAEQYENNYSTQLNGAINSSVTTITVDAGPVTMTGQFRIKIDDEIIIVGTASGTSFTGCTRGAEGTTAASHADNAVVTHILTAISLQTSSPNGATFPSQPTFGNSRPFFRTDRNLLYYYDGTRWLTVNEYSLTMALVDTLQPHTSSNQYTLFATTDHADNIMWISRWVVSTIVLTPNDGSNYWTLQLQKRVAAGTASSLGSSFNTSGDTVSQYVKHVVTINQGLATTDIQLRVDAQRTGGGGSLYYVAAVIYRLVG